MAYKENECPHCGFEAKSAGGLTQHIDLKHKDAMAPEPEPKKANGDMIRCRVHRTNCAEENTMIPITVNPCSQKLGGKKIFMPGDEVELTPTQFNILKSAVEPHDLIIPSDSGIYNSADPFKSARDNYPGYTIRRDPNDGRLHATMDVSNYIVERL